MTSSSASETLIPECQGDSPHLNKIPGQNFDQVTSVPPQKSTWKSWLPDWLVGSKVSSTPPQAKLPSSDETVSKKITQLTDRSAEYHESDSSSLWDYLPSWPQWLSGGSVKSAEVDPEISVGTTRSEQKSSAGLTDRSVEETAPQQGLWQRFMNQAWFRGSEVKPTPPSAPRIGYVPPSERPLTTESGGVIKSIKDWGASLISSSSWLNQLSGGLLGQGAEAAASKADGLVKYFTGNTFAGHTREFLSNRGITIPGVSEEQFQAILGKITGVLANTVQDSREFVEIAIPTLEIDTGQMTPLRVKGLKAKIRLIPLEQDCALVQTQRFQRTIELEDVSCHIELPRPDQLPATLDIAIPKGSLTIGSDLLDVTGIGDIARVVTKSANDSLPFDHTAIQLKTASMTVDYDKLNAALPFDPLAPPSLTDSGIIGFHKGSAKFKDFSFSTPLSLLRKSPEYTTVHCGGFELTNESNRDPMVHIRKIDILELSQEMSGRLKLDIGLDLRKLKHFPFVSLIPEKFLNIQMDCQADVDLVEGEVDIRKAKSGIKMVPAASNWWSRKVSSWLNEAMASEKTRLVMGEDGKPRVHLHIGILETLRKLPFIGNYIPNELPLPLTGLMPSEDHQGRFVVTDLLSGVVEGLQSSWFGIPGKAQLVRKDNERLCVAAASGSLPVSKTLFTRATQMQRSGHHGEARRMLLAIPYSHYTEISLDPTLADPTMLSTVAHYLSEIDPDKAIAVYGLVLKNSPVGELPEGYNQQTIMDAAAKLDINKPNELKVAIDVYEFLAVSKPDSSALTRLHTLCKSKHYPPEQMSDLLVKTIERLPYAGNLGRQAGMLEEMEPLLGEHISEVIACIPTAGVTDQYGIPAQDVADILERLMMKYGHYVQTARMYQSMGQTEKSRRILENAVAEQTREAPQALMERVTSEIFHGTYGNPRFVSAYRLLTNMGKQVLIPSLEQNRQHLLKILWRETRGQNIQWPGQQAGPGSSEAASQYYQAVNELFAINPEQLASSEVLYQALSNIKQKMDQAMADSREADSHYADLREFARLTEQLLADTSIALQLESHLGFAQEQQQSRRMPGSSRQP